MQTCESFTLPFNSRLMKDRYLVTNRLGSWAFLSREAFRQFHSLNVLPGTELYNSLLACGLILDKSNIDTVIDGYRRLNRNLFQDTCLHIAVITTRCNLRCEYCQAAGWAVERGKMEGACGCAPEKPVDRTDPGTDMTAQVAIKVLQYLFDVQTKHLTLEFQGGEPLLNWPVLSGMVQKAREFNTSGKSLSLTVVSNLMLLDEEKMKFLAENDVAVCTSLDGPEDIHDLNRRDLGGRGSYCVVMDKVRRYRERHGRQISFLPTITRASLKHARRIVDEFVNNGQKEISLRPMNAMGSARCSWKDLGYSAEEFMVFYREAMEYILELNRKGTRLSERMARMIISKVVYKKDPMFVDFMNPCGAGRACITYMPDGGCYPCDEARMIGEDIFKLGNILKDGYKDVMRSENLQNLLQSSCTDLWHNASVFSPWTGYCPVINYGTEHNVVPKTACSVAQKIQNGQFEYIFGMLAEGGSAVRIITDWVERK